MGGLKTTIEHPAMQPSIVIDRGYFDRLEALATSIARRTPSISERLLEELDRAHVVEATEMPCNVVTIGNVTTYRDETTGQEQTVILVLPGDADIAHGHISVLTPIGVALLGLSEGAEFSWDTRHGESRRLTVVRVAPV